MEGKGLREKENNYIAAISTFEDGYGIAYTDLSTGENSVTIIENHFDLVLNELSIIGAKEVVVQSQFKDHLQKQLQERLNATISIEDDISEKPDYRKLLSTINEHSMRISIIRLFNYLYRTQKRNLDHLQPVAIVEINQFLKIDYYSKRNLEITETIRSKGKKGSLLWLLDETMTAMGGRLLKHWLDRPLINQKEIEQRQLVVETFIEHFFERQDIREKLKEVYDLERLAGRVAFGNVNARDLIQLKSSLQQIPIIRQLIEQLELDFVEQLDPCEELVDVLERAIIDNPPLSIKEGGIIKDGYNEELDKYRDASRNGKNWLAQLEQEERSRTGIKSLKIGYNRVFGYFIEVTKSNLHLLEEGRYDRKQTLANAERFITPELKEKESLILQAEEKSVELEYELFLQIREVVKEYIPRLQNLAKIVSEIDVLQCFATISESRHYVKPLFNSERKVIIKEGRHPVVEKVMNAQEYVPNDCYMDAERELLLITGPNMSGKSTYMRQIALTSILAQIGCFVPAREAILPIFDQVFTRIGAADDLISGQSTFMVEMLEAKNAIANATKNSLILFDEIGRGTSTYDGMALAQAIIEYIHTQIGAKTLFSTHYHELTVLAETLPQLKNVHVSAIEQNGTVVFLHKIKEGPADKSYGIHVAELAELPKELIVRANEILRQLENQNNKHEQVAPKKEEHSLKQLSLFEETDTKVKKEITSKEKKIVEELKDINLLELNPLQAMNTLYELQKKLKG
ncbi:DNA mismatch repair protein MutS [Heyndrickxia sporothermodurans]